MSSLQNTDYGAVDLSSCRAAHAFSLSQTRIVEDPEQLVTDPVVSICMTTFQHEHFISRALDSVLAQRLEVPFEIIISDDASTDGTLAILEEYQRRYPQWIRVMVSEQNLWPFTGNGRLNFIRTLCAARAPLTALLEGDDYWTDPDKLSEQIQFMDSNPDYSSCFHDADVVWSDSNRATERYCRSDVPASVTLRDLVKRNVIPTASVMFRTRNLAEEPDEFMGKFAGDWYLHVTNAMRGPIHFDPKVRSVYQKHDGGVTSNRIAMSEGCLRFSVFLLNALPGELQSDVKGMVRRHRGILFRSHGKRSILALKRLHWLRAVRHLLQSLSNGTRWCAGGLRQVLLRNRAS